MGEKAALYLQLVQFLTDMNGIKSVKLINEISRQFFDQHLKSQPTKSRILNQIEKHQEIVFN